MSWLYRPLFLLCLSSLRLAKPSATEQHAVVSPGETVPVYYGMLATLKDFIYQDTVNNTLNLIQHAISR